MVFQTDNITEINVLLEKAMYFNITNNKYLTTNKLNPTNFIDNMWNGKWLKITDFKIVDSEKYLYSFEYASIYFDIKSIYVFADK